RRAPARARGEHRQRPRQDAGVRQRPGGGRRRASPPVRAVLLDQAARYRPRPRDREAHGRGARRTHRRGAGPGPRPHVRRGAAARGAPRGPLDRSRLIAAAIEFVPAILFAIWATIGRRGMRERFPDLPWFVPHPAALMAVHYLLSAFFQLLPPEILAHPPAALIAAYCLGAIALIVALPGFRHVGQIFIFAEPPSGGWLVRNYGSALLMCVLAVFFPVLIPLPTFPERLIAYKLVVAAYVLVMGGLMLLRVRHVARPGGWHAGGIGGPRYRDVAL